MKSMLFASSCLPTVVVCIGCETRFCMQNPRVDGVKRTPNFPPHLCPTLLRMQVTNLKICCQAIEAHRSDLAEKDKKWRDSDVGQAPSPGFRSS